MVYDEPGYFLILALKQSLKAVDDLPSKLPTRERSKLSGSLKKFSEDIIDHMSGQHRREKPLKYFSKRADAIERQADRLSDRTFTRIPIRLKPIFQQASSVTEAKGKKDEYGLSLRQFYTRQRISLIQQVAGARLYPNNADLGGEFELCIKDWLQKNLGSDVVVTLGGHIYDLDGNRSDQIDIIISIADSIPFQPSSRNDGKAMVLIEYVVAAITIKTRITPKSFAECWKNIQSIPEYKNVDKERKHLGAEYRKTWPLCFVMCEEASSMDKVQDAWKNIDRENLRHDFQLLYSLADGFL